MKKRIGWYCTKCKELKESRIYKRRGRYKRAVTDYTVCDCPLPNFHRDIPKHQDKYWTEAFIEVGK